MDATRGEAKTTSPMALKRIINTRLGGPAVASRSAGLGFINIIQLQWRLQVTIKRYQ